MTGLNRNYPFRWVVVANNILKISKKFNNINKLEKKEILGINIASIFS